MNGTCSPIVFFDSGVGGLPYLDHARQVLPGQRFAYFADRAGFPYGGKAKEEIIKLAVEAAGLIVCSLDPKVLVIACNTATELAINTIRSAHPGLPIVGTVPAIKPAAALSKVRRIAVVATERAVHDPYLLDLAARWAADCHVERIGDGRLVEFVETRLIGSTEAERLDAVRPSVKRALDADSDSIVLGCTHFIHLAREFALLAGPEVRIIDSRLGVTDQLVRILGAQPSGTNGTEDKKGDAMMYLSGPEPFGSRYESFASRFGLVPAGSLLP
jgi:glutamate racemase